MYRMATSSQTARLVVKATRVPKSRAALSAPTPGARFAPLTPANDVLRDDPFDNQTGEMVVDGVGLSRYETVETREATISEP